MIRIARHVGLFLLYGTLGAFIVLLVGALVYLESREDLDIWHRADLPSEYHADGEITTFQDYLALEEALFAELSAEVLDRLPPSPANIINRYARDSISSPERWARDWNRSYELSSAEPVAGVLMLHGMSDSPYSLRALAERLHAEGVHVVGLRYPGHGTAPASLTRTTWEDMYGAVALAARHLETVLGDDKPLYVFGYSTGGPLAVELSLRALADEDVPLPEGLVLFSPAMGITPLAALTPWQARLGRVLGLEKVAWNSIEIEYDPFKYRSFPLNAAVQVWRLANHVNAGLAAAAETAGSLGE
ncbi:MAG: alpha/beta fold hydrolase, partial [Gammaproteobacteria bacterium]